MSIYNGWILICSDCGMVLQKSGNEPRSEEYSVCRRCEDEIRRQQRERVDCVFSGGRGRWFSNGDDDE